jgi:hypothetical protein
MSQRLRNFFPTSARTLSADWPSKMCGQLNATSVAMLFCRVYLTVIYCACHGGFRHRYEMVGAAKNMRNKCFFLKENSKRRINI